MQLKDASILIVDDEVRLLTIFQKWFEREGCNVFTAENGEQALELQKTLRVALIISDVRMPRMGGVELVKSLKKIVGYLPKILFLSGFTDIDERDCCDLGIEMTLHKPIRRVTLVSAASVCLTDHDALWREPSSSVPERNLEAVFKDLPGARDQGLIAFGHGGICVRSALAARSGETIGLNLEFTADHHALAGQGIVRWAVQHEEQIGIEITYIDDKNRAWILGLTKQGETASFIPRSSKGAPAHPIVT
jgi:CheY-like chemotaxis protein